MSDKQLILNTVQNIDDTTSYEEILYALYTQLEVQRGIKDMEKGNTKTSNEGKEIIYSMIKSLSKEKECTMSNAYISDLLNITNIQASRIVNSLKKKGYIKIEIIYKENSKEIALRKIMPINKNVNTYKQISAEPIILKLLNKCGRRVAWK